MVERNSCAGSIDGNYAFDNRPRTHRGMLVPYAAPTAELQAMAGSTGPTRWAAFVALGHSFDALALWTLLRSTLSKDWEVRRAACEALGSRTRRSPVVDRISELLDDPVPAVVRMACSVLGKLRAEAYRHRVLALLKDPDAATRYAAVAAIDRLWQSGDSPLLLHVASNDASREVSAGATAVLLQHVGASSWARLFDAWIEHPVARHRISACGLAMRFGDRSNVERILSLRIDPDEGVRRAADRTLGRLRDAAVGRRVGRPCLVGAP